MVDDQANNTFSRLVQPHTFRRLLDDGGTALPRTAGCRRFAVRCAPASRPGSTRTTTALHERENVLSAWLQRASYETGFVGKHMNK